MESPSFPETAIAPYSDVMSLDLSFRARFWLPVAVFLCLAWGNPATASEPVAPSNSDGDAVAIETETVAAVLGTRTLPDGTRTKEWLPAADIRRREPFLDSRAI